MSDNKRRKLLMIAEPELYQLVVDIFYETHNLHPHDFQADVLQEETGYHMKLSFGEQYNNTKELFLTFDEINHRTDKLINFVKETADACREVMVKEYFKMMKP